jgi:hypothetical protein
MSPEQRERRNRAISEGQRRAWANSAIHERRSAAIRHAWDDPLRRASMSKRKIVPGSRRESEGWYD